jgi:acyl-CoA reductase-like NAD-dependent aldehyde dehydrogenase
MEAVAALLRAAQPAWQAMGVEGRAEWLGKWRHTLQTSTAPPSTVMDVPVAIGCCIAYT